MIAVTDKSEFLDPREEEHCATYFGNSGVPSCSHTVAGLGSEMHLDSTLTTSPSLKNTDYKRIYMQVKMTATIGVLRCAYNRGRI